MRIHSLLSPKCCVRQSPSNGRGVFAKEAFEAGELVAVWGGKVYTAEECARLSQAVPQFSTHAIGICEGYFLGSDNLFEFDDSELFNHSCDPNIGIRGQIILLTRRPVPASEELVFDYETIDTDPGNFTCRCGAADCRGTLDGNAWRDPGFQRRHRGWLSCYIEDLIAESRKTPRGMTSLATA